MQTDTDLAITIPPGSIAEQLLSKIEENGGIYRGTLALCSDLDAAPRMAMYTLRLLRERGLVRSRRTRGGYGHKSTHRLACSLHSHGGRKINSGRAR